MQNSAKLLPFALRHVLATASHSGTLLPHALADAAAAHTSRGYAVLPSPASNEHVASTSRAEPPRGAASRQPPRLVIYRGRWIKIVRYAVRAKVAQLMGAGGVALGLAGLGSTDLSLLDAAVLAGIIMGSVGGSLSLWYYGRRYVGELSLLQPSRSTLRFSVLDMWGNREDVDVPIKVGFTPPFKNMPNKAIEHICNQLLFPVNCEVPGQGRRQFYVSVVAGQLLQGALFMQLLKGEYVPPGNVGPQQQQQEQQQQQQQQTQ